MAVEGFFGSVVFDKTVVRPRGEAYIVAIWMAVRDDDVDMEYWGGQRVAALEFSPYTACDFHYHARVDVGTSLA